MSISNNLPLEGVRVIDFTQVMMGPAATQMLGDLGADIIKVENPKGGDLSRTSVSFDGTEEERLNNPIYCSLNRNKRSLALNLREAEAKEVIYALVLQSDVVISNFRAGVMERLGFGYEKLKEINPKIIFAMGSGYGQKGPYAHKGGQDVLAQAMSGVMMRKADASIPTSIYPTTLCDYTAGMHLVQAVLAAIINVMKTGEGQAVEVSLYDSMIAMQMQEATCQLNTGTEINWAEMPLTGVFETKDSALVLVGAFKPNPLQDICSVLGIEDLSTEYPNLEIQKNNKRYIQDRFIAEFSKNTTGHWIEKLEQADLLCAPVRTMPDVLQDPQTAVNNMIAEFNHPLNGNMRVIASPVHLSRTKFKIRHVPPMLGEHNAEILEEFGIKPKEMVES